MKRAPRRALLVLLALFLFIGATAFAGPQDISITEGDPITFDIVGFQQGGMYIPPEDDIVGKAIQAKTRFRVNIKEMHFEKQGNWTDELNLFAAANNWPDLLVFPTSGIDTVARFGDNFLDIEQYMTDAAATPNMHAIFGEKLISRMTTLDGKYYYWPLMLSTPDLSDPSVQENFPEVWYANTTSGFYLSMREDILTQLGYKFTSTADLIKKVDTTGERLTLDDLKLDPPIDTFADLEAYLNKVKDANLTNKDGLPVMAFGGGNPVFAIGGAFGFDFFRKNADGSIHCFYGNPNTKEMFKMLNSWTRGGLLDKDIYMLKGDQLQQKVMTGQSAVWINGWLGGENEIRAGLIESYNTDVRLVPMPVWKPEVKRGCDDSYPGAGQGLLINKNFQQVDELFAYLDWLYSPDAQDIVVWGDGEGTVWQRPAEKKEFIDPTFYQKVYVENGKTDDGKDANYYGLKATSPYTILFNRHYEMMNPNSVGYSYPKKLDGWNEIRRIAGTVLRDYTSEQMTSIPHGEYAGRANNFFWAQSGDYDPKLILAEDDSAFEDQWQVTYDAFMEAAEDYEQMQKDMAPFIGASN